MYTNMHGQPVGQPLPDWRSPPHPPRVVLSGRYCRVEPIDQSVHAAALYAANQLDTSGEGWTYLSFEPFTDFESYQRWVESVQSGIDPMFHAIIDLATGKAVGVATYMRIDPKGGVIEVGNLRFSPLMQRSRVATEAMYLMMKQAFALGYRRYEWKCDALNAPSRAAAQRFGFSYEGLFRQATVYKGRNRDTAWYSIIDTEWPALDQAFTRWLAPENFGPDGRQAISLSALTAPLRAAG